MGMFEVVRIAFLCKEIEKACRDYGIEPPTFPHYTSADELEKVLTNILRWREEGKEVEDKFEYVLLWRGDGKRACGRKADFSCVEEFVSQVHKEYTSIVEKEYFEVRVSVEPCIMTEDGVPADSLTLLSETDVTIENYYVADIDTGEDF